MKRRSSKWYRRWVLEEHYSSGWKIAASDDTKEGINAYVKHHWDRYHARRHGLPPVRFRIRVIEVSDPIRWVQAVLKGSEHV